MKFKYSILVFILLFAFINTVNGACADSRYRCNSGTGDNFIVAKPNSSNRTIVLNYDGGNNIYVYYRQQTNTAVFCIRHGARGPSVAESGVNYCNNTVAKSNNETTNNKLRAAIGYAIDAFNYELPRQGLNIAYYGIQNVIHKILNVKLNEPSPESSDLIFPVNGTNYNYNAHYNNAIDAYDSYGDESLSFSTSNLTFTKSGSNFVSNELTITNSHLPTSYSIDLKIDGTAASSSYVSISNGKLKVTIPATALGKAANPQVSLKISSSRTYSLASFKSCGSNVQPIVESTTTSDTRTKSASASGTINNLGSLIVHKINSNNDVLAQLGDTNEARFRLYDNLTCSGTPIIPDFEAEKTVPNLDPTKYYIQEYQTKNGYHTPEDGEDGYCQEVIVSAGTTAEVTITNKTECEQYFETHDMTTMAERVKLYNKINTNYGHDFNALLNLKNKKAVDACKNLTCTSPPPNTCLKASYDVDFSEDNWSCYTDKVAMNNGKTGYCKTSFSLDTSSSYKNQENKVVKSGQLYFNVDNGILLTGSFKQQCYFAEDIPAGTTQSNPHSISDYIKDVKLESDPNINLHIKSNATVSFTRNSGTNYSYNIGIDYLIPGVWVDNLSGKVASSGCTTCKFLGYGVLSKFNQSGEENLKFTAKFDTERYGTKEYSSTCTYSAGQEIIKNNELELEFRSIKVENAFPGKTGEGREPKKNWNIANKEKILKEKPNSYGIIPKTGAKQTAKYTIELTPDAIKRIREEMKDEDYDDNNYMICNSGGTNCISEYLTKLKNRNVLKINSSSKRKAAGGYAEIKPE